MNIQTKKNESQSPRLLHLNLWLKNQLNLDANSEMWIAGIYDTYRLDAVSKGVLPIKPKSFSKELRLYWASDLSKEKVKFFYKDGPKIAGVGFKHKALSLT